MEQDVQRDAIALILQIADVDELDRVIMVAQQRRITLAGTSTPRTPEPIKVLAVIPTHLELGTHVRVNSPKNYSFHGHTGLVTKTRLRSGRMWADILCDKGQRRDGIIKVSFNLLEVIS